MLGVEGFEGIDVVVVSTEELAKELPGSGESGQPSITLVSGNTIDNVVIVQHGRDWLPGEDHIQRQERLRMNRKRIAYVQAVFGLNEPTKPAVNYDRLA